MNCIIKFLDIIALITQFIGALVMYMNSPINKITQTQLGGSANTTIPNFRNKWLRNGFLILSIGLLMSIILLVIKDFFVTSGL